MIVDIFIPCYIDQFFPETAWNMVKVLESLNCAVNYNPEQTCCGHPAFNNGNWDDCKEIGEKFIKEFLNDRYIVVPSASCVSFIKKQYGELFHNSALHNEYKQIQKNIYEFTDFVVNVLKITNIGAQLDGRAVFMDTCVSLGGYGLRQEPRTLLEKVKGLELVEMSCGDTCCGFGGFFSVKYEAISTAMAEQKVQHALDANVEYIVATETPCLMHLDGYMKAAGKPMKVMHIADVLASGWL
jgi:L-lactate dehydrogenase complex protein LldE